MAISAIGKYSGGQIIQVHVSEARSIRYMRSEVSEEKIEKQDMHKVKKQ